MKKKLAYQTTKPSIEPEPTAVLAPTGTGAGIGTSAPTGEHAPLGAGHQPAQKQRPSNSRQRPTGTVESPRYAQVLPKLRSGKDLKIGIDFSVTVEAANANDLQVELKQILTDLGLQDSFELVQS